MIINVTKKDIEDGQKLTGFRAVCCPIALAVKRRTNATFTTVGVLAIHVDDRQFSTPSKAAKFIRDFDAGRPVKPMRFSI